MGADQAKRRPTILDVAHRAGVSRAAVSRVIRDAYGVSADMRAKVEAAIADLGYRPRVSARGMRGATYTLGLAVPNHHNTLRDTFFNRVLYGALTALEDTPYHLILAPSDAVEGSETSAIEALADRQVDGIIATNSAAATPLIEELAAYLPVVGLGNYDPAAGYDTLVGDDLLGAALAVRHLHGLGHRRIVHITQAEGPAFATAPHTLRVAGYQQAMRELGLADGVTVASVDDSWEAARDAARQLLEEAAGPVAVFATNDALALGVLQARAELGLGPGQASVVGYDDTDVAAHPFISLTSVNQLGKQMGEICIRLLLERINGRRQAVHEVVVPRVVARASTAPPA
jgi:LacI family transcriptional regulator